MATCKKCGQEIADDAKFCPSCGASTEETTSEKTASSASEDKLKKVLDTKDTTGDFDAQDIENNKAMGILAYLFWLVLIPLFGAKNSAYALFTAIKD